MLWTIEGKAAAEIAVFLGISERTVVFHIENLKRKFGVMNKQHLVAKAVSMGDYL